MYCGTDPVAKLLTVTTREPSTGSNRSSRSPVKAKWPKWLVPNCISKPSLVVDLGVYMTPALLISRSMRYIERSSAAALRTDSSEVRSSSCNSTSAPGVASVMRAAACLPFSGCAPPSRRVRRGRPVQWRSQNQDRCWRR